MTTQTYTATAKGQRYEMTVKEVTTPAGTPGVLITCSCATHRPDASAAIVATPSGADFPRARIHGHVTMAHSVAGAMGTRQNKIWAR